MATHPSVLAWRIPWTEEPDGLQSMGSQRVGHDWATHTHTHTHRLCGQKGVVFDNSHSFKHKKTVIKREEGKETGLWVLLIEVWCFHTINFPRHWLSLDVLNWIHFRSVFNKVRNVAEASCKITEPLCGYVHECGRLYAYVCVFPLHDNWYSVTQHMRVSCWIN